MLTLYSWVYEDFYTVDVTTLRIFTSLHSVLLSYILLVCDIYSVGNVLFLALAQNVFVFLYFLCIFCICVTPILCGEYDALYGVWWLHWFYQFGSINWVFHCKYFDFIISMQIIITKVDLGNSELNSFIVGMCPSVLFEY